MLQALDTALAGYTARMDDMGRLAERIRGQRPDEDLTGDMVAVTASQRAAEANLAVAHAADETSQSLIHVIA
jgi:hypothetical protein